MKRRTMGQLYAEKQENLQKENTGFFGGKDGDKDEAEIPFWKAAVRYCPGSDLSPSQTCLVLQGEGNSDSMLTEP